MQGFSADTVLWTSQSRSLPLSATHHANSKEGCLFKDEHVSFKSSVVCGLWLQLTIGMYHVSLKSVLVHVLPKQNGS